MTRKAVQTVSAPRMLAVLHLIAQGHTYVHIGRILGITENTVKTRTRALFEDLGARDRAHAVHLGHERGYFGVGDDHNPWCALRHPHVCTCTPEAQP